MNYKIHCRHFKALTVDELYAIIRLRNEVFVVEQNCVFQDADNKDQQCYHLTIWDQDELIAYARVIPAGVSYDVMSIGRVVTAPKYRRMGVGVLLMQKAIESCNELFGEGPIKVGAQLYLKKFYEGLGFVQCSEEYDEDGIPHILMMNKE